MVLEEEEMMAGQCTEKDDKDDWCLDEAGGEFAKRRPGLVSGDKFDGKRFGWQ